MIVQLRYTTGMRRRQIGGRYVLQEQLGTSSWHAIDTELERDVFVRVPARRLVIARLVHPSIVQVFDQGDDNGKPYVVYEYLSGGSLAQRLDKGSLSQAEAGRIASDITAALAYAHAQGVTHGALGPATILLDDEGAGKVAEFAGVATQEDDEHALTAVLEILSANAIADSDADATAVLQPAAAATRRQPIALSTLAALVLLVAGVGAAFLSTSGESTSDNATDSVSHHTSTESTGGATQAPVVPQPGTTSEQSTEQKTAPSPTTEPPLTNSPPPTEPATTVPPVTTEPPPATTEPPADNRAAADHGTAACHDRAAACHDRAAAADLSPDRNRLRPSDARARRWWPHRGSSQRERSTITSATCSIAVGSGSPRGTAQACVLTSGTRMPSSMLSTSTRYMEWQWRRDRRLRGADPPPRLPGRPRRQRDLAVPFQPSPNRDNGYDITDFYAVDPRSATGGLRRIHARAKKHGIRVLIDLVVNHTSDQPPWFQAARADPESKYRDWYVWSKKRPPNGRRNGLSGCAEVHVDLRDGGRRTTSTASTTSSRT